MIRKRIVGLVLILACIMPFATAVQAQHKVPNMAEHDDKLYYFGLTFGFNYSAFRVGNTPSFAQHDTFKVLQPGYGPGFNMGLMGTLKLTKFIDLRFVPSLVFSEKKLSIINQDNVERKESIESIYMQLPLQLKFKSDRIGNFRFYGLLSGKFDYDLASNARSRKQNELIKVKAMDVGAEVGIGFEFFYPNFIFTPEIKLSQGFLNSHYPDKDIPLSNTVDYMHTRMIVFSIHLQG